MAEAEDDSSAWWKSVPALVPVVPGPSVADVLAAEAARERSRKLAREARARKKAEREALIAAGVLPPAAAGETLPRLRIGREPEEWESLPKGSVERRRASNALAAQRYRAKLKNERLAEKAFLAGGGTLAVEEPDCGGLEATKAACDLLGLGKLERRRVMNAASQHAFYRRKRNREVHALIDAATSAGTGGSFASAVVAAAAAEDDDDGTAVGEMIVDVERRLAAQHLGTGRGVAYASVTRLPAGARLAHVMSVLGVNAGDANVVVEWMPRVFEAVCGALNAHAVEWQGFGIVLSSDELNETVEDALKTQNLMCGETGIEFYMA